MSKYRKMLSSWEAPYLQSLIKLMESQSKTTLIMWVLDYAEMALLPIWVNERVEDVRPQAAIQAARSWLRGDMKLPVVKQKILALHAAARELDDQPALQGIARAIAQSASTIHMPRHAIGLALYGSLALAYHKLGINTPFNQLEEQAAIECKKMENALRKIAIIDEKNPAKISWKC